MITQTRSSKHKDLTNIIRNFKTHENKVELSLFCVKSVQHFNDKLEIQTGINLIEKWLKNKNSISIQECKDFAKKINESIHNAYNSYYALDVSASYVAYSVCQSLYTTWTFSNDAFIKAIGYAALAKAWNNQHDNTQKINELRRYYTQQYIVLARNWERRFINFIPDKELLSIADTNDNYALFDKLSDLNLSVIKPNNNKFYADIFGLNIEGDSEIEVIQELLNVPIALTIVKQFIKP